MVKSKSKSQVFCKWLILRNFTLCIKTLCCKKHGVTHTAQSILSFRLLKSVSARIFTNVLREMARHSAGDG